MHDPAVAREPRSAVIAAQVAGESMRPVAQLCSGFAEANGNRVMTPPLVSFEKERRMIVTWPADSCGRW
jgi:hypothetical protein